MGLSKKQRVGFCMNQTKKRESRLAMEAAAGFRKFGFEIKQVGPDDTINDCDLICVIGVKSMNRMSEANAAGIPYLYFDKGYSRKPGYWRIGLNSHQPTEYLNDIDYPEDRRIMFDWNPKPWRKNRPTDDILFAGSSLKFHVIKNLSHPTEYAQDVINRIRTHAKRRIVYRPKPSWKEAEPIKGTVFSREKGIENVFDRTGVLITYGSNSCFEALLNGIPSIILGDAVTRSISDTSINEHSLLNPRKASEPERLQLLNNLAYYQWKPDELESGLMWENVRFNLQL